MWVVVAVSVLVSFLASTSNAEDLNSHLKEFDRAYLARTEGDLLLRWSLDPALESERCPNYQAIAPVVYRFAVGLGSMPLPKKWQKFDAELPSVIVHALPAGCSQLASGGEDPKEKLRRAALGFVARGTVMESLDRIGEYLPPGLEVDADIGLDKVAFEVKYEF